MVLQSKLSPKWDFIIFFIIILTVIMGVLILDTLSSPSQVISQMTGPAIGGVIAVAAGYLLTKWGEDEKEVRRKQYLARVFLSELHKIRGFIAGIDALGIKSEHFSITRPPLEISGIIQRDPRPPYDPDKYHALLYYFQHNDFIRVTDTSPLVSKKNPFEIFSQEIYSFEDSDLISYLFKIDNLMNEANSELLTFFEKWEQKPEGFHTHLFLFLRKIETVKPIVQETLNENKLKSIGK